jgi:phosphoribosylanthranilate isomerase
MEDVAYINEAMPDFAGFVFVPESRRYIAPHSARQLRGIMDGAIISVGVFRDADPRLIEGLAGDGTIGAIQLHGAESDGYIASLRGRLDSLSEKHIPIIRAVRVSGADSFARPSGAGAADILLYDNGSGGTGKSFGIELLDAARTAGKLPDLPFFLAGGIGEGNIGEAARRRPYGIDVSSGAESGGAKDREKILALVNAVRDMDNNLSARQ